MRRLGTRDLYRNSKLDFIKGVAAFLVLWGHIVQYGITDYSFFEAPMYKLIYSFHMPVFIAISGYLFYRSFYRYPFTTLIRKKITKILYPGVVWGGIQEIVIALKMYPAVKPVPAAIVGIFTDVWFMWTLFWISIVVAFAMKLSRGRMYLLIPLLVFAGIALYYIPNNEGNLFMYPFFVMGMLYSRFEGNLMFIILRKKLIGVSSILLFVFMLYGFTSYRLLAVGGLYVSGRGDILNDLYRYFTGFLGIVAFIYICRFIYDNIVENSKIIEQTVKLAKYSGELYCVQCIVIAELGGTGIRVISHVMGYNPLTYNPFVFETLSAPIVARVFILIFLYCMEWLGNHKRLYKVLFGW